jgi:hypothetical protein
VRQALRSTGSTTSCRCAATSHCLQTSSDGVLVLHLVRRLRVALCRDAHAELDGLQKVPLIVHATVYVWHGSVSSMSLPLAPDLGFHSWLSKAFLVLQCLARAAGPAAECRDPAPDSSTARGPLCTQHTSSAAEDGSRGEMPCTRCNDMLRCSV